MEKVNQTLINIVGNNIKKFREEKNITRNELSSKLHITVQAISQYENCKRLPSSKLQDEIAVALGVSTDELLTGITEYDKNKISDNAHNFYSSPLLNKAINNISSKIRIEHWDDKIYLWLNGKHEISPQMEQKVVSLLESNIDNLLESLTLLLKEGE